MRIARTVPGARSRHDRGIRPRTAERRTRMRATSPSRSALPPAAESYPTSRGCWRRRAIPALTPSIPATGFSRERRFRGGGPRGGANLGGAHPESMRRMGEDRVAGDHAGGGRARGVGFQGHPGDDARPLRRRPGRSDSRSSLKASAGGGAGCGASIASRISSPLAGARREAVAAFADPAVYWRRRSDRPRHVEIQIFGDARGAMISLFERECSIQTPPEDRRRGALRDRRRDPPEDGEAAAAGRAVGYRRR